MLTEGARRAWNRELEKQIEVQYKGAAEIHWLKTKKSVVRWWDFDYYGGLPETCRE